MTKRNNPYSTRWDKPNNHSKLTGLAAQLYQTFDVIQNNLYFEGMLIEMDPMLYIPALEIWIQQNPEYRGVLMNLAALVEQSINREGTIPGFAAQFFFSIFTELDVMVNGESLNHVAFVNRFR